MEQVTNEGEEHPQWDTTTRIYCGDSTFICYKVTLKIASSGMSGGFFFFSYSKKAKINK